MPASYRCATRPLLGLPLRRPAGVLGAWAVHHQPAAAAAGGEVPQGQGEGYHTYLLMSFPDGTKVLSTGEELREVTET